MRFSFRALVPTRISSQIAAIILVSLIAIHAILTAAFILRLDINRAPRDHPAQIATFANLLDATDEPLRSQVADVLAEAFPRFQVRLLPPGAIAPKEIEEHDGRAEILQRRVAAHLHAFFIASPESDHPETAAVRLRDGAVLTARFPPPPGWRFDPLISTVLAIAVSMTLLGWWAARTLRAPLRAFARAAENFRPDGEIELLPESGPDEIRSAASALNRMRARIKSLIEDRTRMMAAVGHDLRTPITRLRLRSEFIEDATFRGHMLADLNQMQAMVEKLLLFLRDGHAPKTLASIDLAALAVTICDQFSDMGHEVTYSGPDHLTLRADSDELQRAITNVVENAIRYGERAAISLRREQDAAVMEIDDDGPGIPGPVKTAMLEPFVRGEAARSMNGTSGFGLGLSITRVIVERHDGTLALLDRAPQGLRVRITLPLRSGGASASAGKA